jgi:two-component sensor histidine kinase
VPPRRVGHFGLLSALVATPLSMVLAELVQNAVEHGLRYGPGTIEVRVRRQAPVPGPDEFESGRGAGRLIIEVVDDGTGLPDDFDLETSSSLGLQIVRTLVTGELAGRLEMIPQEGGGTKVLLDLPVDHEVQYYN